MQENASRVSTFKFRCDECRQKLKVEIVWSGKWMVCPSCDEALEIPFIKVAAPVSASEVKASVISAAPADDVPVGCSAPVEETPAADAPKVYASAPLVVSLEDGDTALPVRGSKSEIRSDKTQPLKKKKMDGERTKTVINIGESKAALKFKSRAKPKAKKMLKVAR